MYQLWRLLRSLSKENYLQNMIKKLKENLKETKAIIIKDLKNYGWGIILIILYLFLLEKIFHGTCLFRVIVGIPCPGCGLTRAAKSLLRLDLKKALNYNAFIYPIVIMAFIAFINRYVRRKKQPCWFYSVIIIVTFGMIFYYFYRLFSGSIVVTYGSIN